MRPRRKLTIAVFIVCALAVLEGLGWVTWQAVRLERREREAQARARFLETIHLALWQMESEITPILAQEAARPYFHYRPFYPAERAYTRMWEEVRPGEVLFPSPLLESSTLYVKLHFQVDASGAVTSPQAPTGNMRDLAESRRYVDSEFIVYAEDLVGELSSIIASGLTDDADRQLRAAGALNEREASKDALLDKAQAGFEQYQQQARKRAAEYASEPQLRSNRAQTAQIDPAPAAEIAAAPRPEQSRDEGAPPAGRAAPGVAVDQSLGPPGDTPEPDVEQGPFTPRWAVNPATGEPELLLLRTIRVEGEAITQGLWMDWPALRVRLLEICRPLLPEARLEPVAGAPADPGQVLASIPVRLDPGPTPVAAAASFTPTHLTLGVTWLAVLGAVVAIGVVLRASMELSDRRGRFVSAVTHELRTPLTTFCLYTEMLADNMVRDEPRRGQYLTTLKGESRRLAGIVENVLDYARLGERAAAAPPAPVPLRDLLEQVRPALAAHAERCGMSLADDTAPADGARVAADPRTVERILLNLVDNACKYAGDADDRRLHLTARAVPGGVVIAVRDHGPGVPRREQRRIFEPFHRARRDAQGPKSGLGLGLALARGLARELGGDLELAPRGPGAEFRLTLPAVR